MQTIDLKFIEYACLRNIQIRHDLQDSAFRLQCTFFTFLVFIGIFFSEQFLYAVINTDARNQSKHGEYHGGFRGNYEKCISVNLHSMGKVQMPVPEAQHVYPAAV